MDVRDLEGVARAELERAGFDDTPVDALDLAHELGIAVEWMPGANAYRFMRRAFIPAGARISRIHGLLTHEIAHILLEQHGLVNDERSANYLGAALLVSRRVLDRQLRDGWDLHALMAYHLNASAELLARRITDIRRASLAIYDAGRFRYRVGCATPLAIERQLVDEALATERPVRVDDLTGAWPMIDGRWRRVLVLGQ